jgi:iron-sulfur cluster assembly protein
MTCIQIKRSKVSITITENAANRVKEFLKNRGKGIGLRLGVKTTGCSGLAYKLEFVDAKAGGDTEFESNGVHIFIDSKSLQFLDGTRVDYTKEGLQEGFKFTNPNVKGECGCGESFTV